MKISRIFLPAMILFSMESSLFGMRPSRDDKDVVVVEEQTHVRRKSHDGTRDGKFGSAQDTFSKLGTSYNPLFGTQNQLYDIGSDEHAPTRWATFGATIKTLADAEKWVKTVTRKEKECPTVNWTPLQESKENAQSIIATDRHNRFTQLNAQITKDLLDAHKIATESEQYKQEQSALYDAQVAQAIHAIRSRQAADFAAQAQTVQTELTTLANEIKLHIQAAVELKSTFNDTKPSRPIIDKLAVKGDYSTTLNHAQLVKIAAAAAAKTKSCC